MLILSRKPGETVVIDGRIRVKIIRVEGDVVKIGIGAFLELDDRGVGQHARLDRVAAEVSDHRLDLRGHEIIGNDVHTMDANGVLGGQRRDRRGAIDAMRGKRLQVGLDAGAAP